MQANLPGDERLQYAGRLFIDGEWTDGSAGTVPVTNPATEEIVSYVAEAGTADAADAAAAARRAQPGWAATPGAERARLLAATAEEIGRRSDALVELMIAECGFTRASCRSHVMRAMASFALAARSTQADHSFATSPVASRAPNGSSTLLNGLVQRRPVGVVTCIVPFNGPLYGAAMKASQALAMGNTVVVKPAPQNPLAVIELFRIFSEVGLPQGVANLVTSSAAAVGVELTTSKNVDMVSFTGSTDVGKRIYEAGAQTMKRLVLELGGKSACIILDDADLTAAAEGLSMTWTMNSGQACAAPTRALIQRSVYEKFLEKMRGLSKTVIVGQPTDPATIAGPVISATQRDRVQGFVESAVSQGAEVMTDGLPDSIDRGYFVAPTLLAECTNQMDAVRSEIFGPVITAIPFDDEMEAVTVANDSDYGLAAYVYSQDTVRAFNFASRLQAGTISINTTAMKPDVPRGGMKMSGIGREGGDMGLHEFTEAAGIVW